MGREGGAPHPAWAIATPPTAEWGERVSRGAHTPAAQRQERRSAFKFLEYKSRSTSHPVCLVKHLKPG